MIHYVPDPVVIPDPPVADIFFTGGNYRLLTDRDLVTFTMTSFFVTVNFEFTGTSISTYPTWQTAHEDVVKEILSEDMVIGTTHTTTMDWGSDAGPEILKHLTFWLRSGINIEIDLTELRKQANT